LDLKPKIGVFLMTGGWFREVGLQPSASNLSGDIEQIASSILKELSKFAECSFSGIVYSEESAKNAAKKAKSIEPDAILVAPLIWSEDIIIKTILKEFSSEPIIFCNFMPYERFKDFMYFDDMLKGCGIVGSLQMSGFLKKEGYKFQPVVGYYKNQAIYNEIRQHLKAVSVNKDLKNLKCGVLPFRCDQMTVTYVDEFNLHKLYGIELKYLELSEVKNIAQSFTKDEISRFKADLIDMGFVIEVDNKNLEEGIKYTLALEKIIKKSGLKALAMNDVIEEMHNCFGLRPCLVNPALSEYGISISMEADIAAVTAMHVLNQFTGDETFYTEILCADLKNNSFIMGHAGYYGYKNCDPGYPVKIVSDPEYKTTDRFSGACMYYKYKPGPVTIVNSIYDGIRLRWTVAEGTSLEGPPLLEGDPHVHFSLDKPLETFFKEIIKIGVSQHWIVVNGHIADDLEILCQWNDIELIRIKNT
jgi:L-arabinose isomerase